MVLFTIFIFVHLFDLLNQRELVADLRGVSLGEVESHLLDVAQGDREIVQAIEE